MSFNIFGHQCAKRNGALAVGFMAMVFCLFTGCTHSSYGQKTKVSFCIDSNTAQKILAQAAGSASSRAVVTVTEDNLQRAKISVSLKGDYEQTLTKDFSAQGVSVSFDKVPVGASVYAQAEIYLETAEGSNVQLCSGKSASSIIIHEGNNTIPLELTVKLGTYEAQEKESENQENGGKKEEPENPTDPTDPTDPTNPSDPSNPSEPGNNTDPENPNGSTEPTDPTNPSNPDNPTDPTYPTNPTDPSDPNNQTDPSGNGSSTDPTDPSGNGNTDPENPNGSTDPTNPTDPTDPTDPNSGTSTGEELGMTITILSTDYDDISVTKTDPTSTSNIYTFTPNSDYTSYRWFVDGVQKSTNKKLTLNAAALKPGIYDVVLEATKVTDSDTQYYSYTIQIQVSAN